MAFKIADKIRKIEQFDFQKNIIEIVVLNEEFLSELLKTQLDKGIDGNGNDVTVRGNSFYAAETIKNKRYMPKNSLSYVIEWITNYMSGSFYAGIKPHTDGNRLWFDSSVPYFQDIITQSGGVIMKLNKTNLELFIRTKLRPELEKRFKNGV